MNMLANLAKARRYPEMETAALALLANQPQSGLAWKALGVAQRMQNKDALDAMKKAAELLPDDPEAQSNLGAAWRRLGELESAAACFQRALELRPDIAEVWNNLGNVHRDLGNLDEALSAYRRALELKPNFSLAHNGLGNAFQGLGALDDAAANYERSLALDPNNAEALTNLGFTRRLQNRTSDAEIACRRVLEIDPNHSAAVILLAELRSDQGNFQEAEVWFRRANAIEPGSPEAWAGIAGLRRMTTLDTVWLAEAQRILGAKLPPRREAILRFALGKYFDDTRDYDRAFEQYRRANALARQGRRGYDRSQVTHGIDRLIHSYGDEWFKRSAGSVISSERPVLIIGMPRSGTTLAEQILAAHADVFGAGELPFWNSVFTRLLVDEGGELDPSSLSGMANDYLGVLRQLTPDARRVVDKMPGNFLYLGLIHAALPKAKFIHLRRHPIDTCLSIFFQNFSDVHEYASDLDDLAQYYAEYQRLMAHWRRVVPAGVLLEVDYEKLVADPEGESRRLVQFIGLPWDPRCCEFHHSSRTVSTFSKWQARQPINRQSVARWRNYEKFIAPLERLVSCTASD
jgi:tetratricopeptide (TPR) repeat protein